MDLKIPETKLQLLLEQKKDEIGKGKLCVTEFSFGLTLLVALLTSDFKDFGPFSAKLITAIFSIVTAALFLLGLFHLFFHRYSYKNLFDDIRELSDIPVEHRIIAVIPNDFSRFPKRFLVYRDRIWDCYLCPHYPVSGQKNIRAENVAKYVSDDLGIPQKHIRVKYIADGHSEKHSMRTDADKEYLFSYFRVFLSKVPPNIRKQNFTIAGKEYSWKTVSELLEDQNTKERNSDVVYYLESHQWK